MGGLTTQGANNPRTAGEWPGTRLCQVPDPDEAVVCEPGRCADCGGELAEAERVGVAARQVFDVPLPPPPHVTAYRVVSAVSLQGGHRRRAAGVGSRAGRLRSGAARTGRERAVRALPAGGPGRLM